MRILVLGARGQLGWELRRALAPLGTVLACARQPGPGIEALDLASAELAERLRQLSPQVIVNAAAYTAVDRAESEPERAMAINAGAVGVLADEAAKTGALLVHYSTDYVFAGNGTRPYREDDPVGPVSAYGRSKLAGERAIADAGCRALVFRTAWVYASRGHNFLRTMLRLAGEREVLRVVADQQGTPTAARLIAEASAQAIARWLVAGPAERLALQGVWHLTASGSTSWHGFASTLLDGARQRGLIPRLPRIEAITTAEFPTPARRPAWSVLDCSRFEAAFELRLPDWRQPLDCVLDELV